MEESVEYNDEEVVDAHSTRILYVDRTLPDSKTQVTRGCQTNPETFAPF